MKHLGDITQINGATIEPVDVITGGSPCQDLSVAGKRAGLAGERSGLFMEQIRIIKEMREADAKRGRPAHLCRPRFMVWENVPGAFSSNGGKDFQAVLTEIVRIIEPDAPEVPFPEKGKWLKSDAYFGVAPGGTPFSVAYRLHDAQFWGVPQRRSRIALVADFGGISAPEILFERKGLSGDSDKGQPAGEEAAGGAGTGASECDKPGGHRDLTPTLLKTHSDFQPVPVNTMLATRCKALGRSTGLGIGEPGDPQVTISAAHEHAVCYAVDCRNGTINPDVNGTLQAKPNGGQRLNLQEDVTAPATYDARGNGDGKVVSTITGDHENRVTDYTALVVEKAIRWIVRRLMPVECERLQGYPDGWTDLGEWTDSKGKRHKDADSPRYKSLGNSIALPFWLWLSGRISAYYDRPATLGSLFDGIGGFPLCWETVNGKGTARWASEIEEFPIAVTKYHFPEKDETEETA